MQCTCNEHSPFLWHKHQRDSIFMSDSYFKARGDTGKTTGQIATDAVEKRRAKGEEPGYLQGLSRKREEEILAPKAKLVQIFNLNEQDSKKEVFDKLNYHLNKTNTSPSGTQLAFVLLYKQYVNS